MKHNKYEKRESEIRTLYKKSVEAWDNFKDETGCTRWLKDQSHSYYRDKLEQDYYHQWYNVVWGKSYSKAPKWFVNKYNRKERLKSKNKLQQFKNRNIGDDANLFVELSEISTWDVEHIGSHYKGANWDWW